MRSHFELPGGKAVVITTIMERVWLVEAAFKQKLAHPPGQVEATPRSWEPFWLWGCGRYGEGQRTRQGLLFQTHHRPWNS